ncbi:1-acyl-sn-glycerol-3-phosphate acyltransferase [Stylosanthes scabra]|uniref:1-acylglycerol-3-phosphate O-acyltransferase n=1 Tax=Stylosanthes scabra TaxID=79078 RepID=A0ABU6VCB9_9FABA|nr:1-acyl-sn-glycerol-3-phosphate acyltransferase [Stylosanthes scabra]
MAFPAAVVILPAGTIFILSGIIVNAIQVVVFVLVRPISRNLFRRINRVLTQSLWLQLTFLIDWWGGIKIEVHTDSETLQLMGRLTSTLLVKSDIDWLIGYALAQRSGCLGSSLAIMKKELKYLPVIGWSMWFADYIFLERDWAKDETTLSSGLKRLEDYPLPFWLALFVEGTLKKGDTPPTMLRIFKGQSSSVKLQIQRLKMEELPQTPNEIAQWCKDLFITKDAMLERYNTTDIFSDAELQEMGRSKISIFVVLCWSCLLGFLLYEFFKLTSLLSTWVGIACTVLFFVIVTVIMEILIHSTQSERSTRMNLPTQDPIRQKLLQ